MASSIQSVNFTFVIGGSASQSLARVVGAERLSRYLVDRRGSQVEALRLYSWNIEASAALLGAYAALEVGVRNAMHERLGEIFARADWWEGARLQPAERAQIDAARSYLDTRKRAGWSTGHVVAELRPSFWEALLANRYHAALWERGLAGAFPYYCGRRAALRERLERLRLLRNRAAHHEPIFARDLMVDHLYMCELAGFIDPDLQGWIGSHSRLPDVIANRPSTVDGSRPGRF
jgi:hypothetical protein